MIVAAKPETSWSWVAPSTSSKSSACALGLSRELSQAHMDDLRTTFGHENEARLDLDVLHCGVKRRHHGIRANMAGAHTDDSDERLAVANRERSEIQIMGQHDATLRLRGRQDLHVVNADKVGVTASNVTSTAAKALDHGRSDVLIGEQRATIQLRAQR